MIAYLERKSNEIKELCPPYRVYNWLTLEIVKIVSLLLQFDLFEDSHDNVKKMVEDSKNK